MKKYDVRAIRMIKSTATNPLIEEIKNSNTYICLGHFDVIRIDNLCNKNANENFPLKMIQDDSQDMSQAQLKMIQDDSQDMSQAQLHKNGSQWRAEGNYCYPLYILRQFPENSADQFKRIGEFWSHESNFLSVTRLHYDWVKSPCEQLVEYSREIGKSVSSDEVSFVDGDEGFIRFSVSVLPAAAQPNSQPDKAGTTFVYVTFYDSLELSDVVGVFKSNSLSAILKVQRLFHNNPRVQEAYTYCAADASLFNSSAGFNEELFLRRVQDQNLADIHLDYVTTRFSIKNVKMADDFFKAFNQTNSPSFFVTGTADVIIEPEECSEKSLLSMMQCLITLPNMYAAFNDVITRIGLTYQSLPVNAATREPPSSGFYGELEEYGRVLDLLKNLNQENADNEKYPWAYALAKMLGTLHTMYENCVMDDLSKLLLPGVGALLKRICYLHENKMFDEVDHWQIFSFLDRWASLTNDIANLESQLVQHPELNVVRYYIPAMVLLFETKLVKSYVEIIEQLNREERQGKKQRTFFPILFPDFEEDSVSTQCFLDPMGDQNYVESSPLGIFLPIHHLYQPWTVAHVLSHELAHYCGDVLRCREKRLDCLIKSSADCLIAFWNYKLGFEYRKGFNTQEREFHDRITIMIQQRYQEQDDSKRLLLQHIAEELPGDVMTVGLGENIFDAYCDLLFIDKGTADGQIRKLQNLFSINRLREKAGEIQLEDYCRIHITECLTSLYKECYADIVMILLLDCSFGDYYWCVYADECKKLEKEKEKEKEDWINAAMETHTNRMALVCLAIDSVKSNWEECDCPKELWCDIAVKKIKNWRTVSSKPESQEYQWKEKFIPNKELSQYTLLADEAALLLDYLQDCAKKISDRLSFWQENDDAFKPKIDWLRESIKCAKSDTFDWDHMRDFLHTN